MQKVVRAANNCNIVARQVEKKVARRITWPLNKDVHGGQRKPKCIEENILIKKP